MQRHFFFGALIGLIVGFILGWVLLKTQLQSAVSKNTTSATDFDQVHNQILTIADILSSGITKQFPDKF